MLDMQKYKNIKFLRAFIERMAKLDPDDRPTSAEASQKFEEIMRKNRGIASRWRLRPKNEPFVQSLRLDAESLVHEIRLQSAYYGCVIAFLLY